MELIKGNWYKTKNNNYYKFDKIENNYYYFSEEIYNKIWEGGRDWCLGSGVVLDPIGLINLEEIQEFLPDNHPDKIINNLPIDEDYTELKILLNKIKNETK